MKVKVFTLIYDVENDGLHVTCFPTAEARDAVLREEQIDDLKRYFDGDLKQDGDKFTLESDIAKDQAIVSMMNDGDIDAAHEEIDSRNGYIPGEDEIEIELPPQMGRFQIRTVCDDGSGGYEQCDPRHPDATWALYQSNGDYSFNHMCDCVGREEAEQIYRALTGCPPENAIDLHMLAENAAAISASFHQSPNWQRFYETHKDRLSGFPGIWQYCAELGAMLTSIEYPGVWDHHEWIDTVDRIAGYVADNEWQFPPSMDAVKAFALTLIPRS